MMRSLIFALSTLLLAGVAQGFLLPAAAPRRSAATMQAAKEPGDDAGTCGHP